MNFICFVPLKNVLCPHKSYTKMFHTPSGKPRKCFIPWILTLRPGMQVKKWTAPYHEELPFYWLAILNYRSTSVMFVCLFLLKIKSWIINARSWKCPKEMWTITNLFIIIMKIWHSIAYQYFVFAHLMYIWCISVCSML